MKKTVNVIKANVQSVVYHATSSHTSAQPSSPVVDCLVDEMK